MPTAVKVLADVAAPRTAGQLLFKTTVETRRKQLSLQEGVQYIHKNKVSRRDTRPYYV